MKRLLTGLQPSGNITLGNYIGAIKQMVKNQDDFESFIFIADMHAITVNQDPEALKNNIKNLLALYIASGIDPKKNTIFLQSDNVYHANLSWVLECMTPYGELTRMTQFKDKKEKNVNFGAGLLTYPVLMASDILLYDADLIPVGQDQKQHVELARNIAQRFNNRFGETFNIPDAYISKSGAKIMDLVDPSKKMSKSSDNPKGIIYLLDDENIIRKKIMGATTDSEMIIKYDPDNKPGISNLITIYNSLTDMSIEDIEKKYEGINYGTFKKDVADIVINAIKPIQTAYYRMINSDELEKILDNGKNKTMLIAEQKYKEVRNKVGLFR